MYSYEKLAYIRTILEQLSEEIPRHDGWLSKVFDGSLDDYAINIDSAAVTQALEYIDDIQMMNEKLIKKSLRYMDALSDKLAVYESEVKE